MKKRFGVALLSTAIITGACLAGCGNKTLFDTTFTYKYAIIQLVDGSVVKGEVET